eukprot:gene39260-62906_t
MGALDWEALADTAASCQACGLCAGRKSATLQPAPGQRDWMVVGDPPEEDEDRAAQAFVESPGLLLDNMLKAVGASRGADAQGATAAYATNVVKCRPPHGQIPQAADLAQWHWPLVVASGNADSITTPASCQAVAQAAGVAWNDLGSVGHACPLEAPGAVNALLGLN